MKTIRPFLFLVFAGMLGSLCAQTNTNPLTVYITYFNTHVQNYTPLDLSGTNVVGFIGTQQYFVNKTGLIALDDSNNAAYGFWTGTNDYDVYTWSNGVSTPSSSFYCVLNPDQSNIEFLSPQLLRPNGQLFGFGLGGGMSIAFSAFNNTVNVLSAPAPYQSIFDCLPNAVASDASYSISFDYDPSVVFGLTNDENAGGATLIIQPSGSSISFDNQPGAFSSGSLSINTAEAFRILKINTNTWAIGSGSSYDPDSGIYYDCGYQIWDGTVFHALNGTPYDSSLGSTFTNNDMPINLNNSNQVIVQGFGTNYNSYTYAYNPTEGYIWQEDTSSNPTITLLRNLIPTTNPPSTNDLAVMAQIQNIEPFAISNIRQTNATDPSNFPILNILATANVRTYAGLTNTQNITNSEIVLISQYPDKSWHFKQCLGLSQSSIQSINANGLIACLSDLPGTNATGYSHAFLELPINLINIDDPTVRNSANGTNIDIAFMTNAGIGTNNFAYRDTNINCVAWIAGNDPTNNNAPRMPWLQAQALGFTNVNTYWKLQVTFHDRYGNPHRDFDTGVAQNTPVPEDTVNIPELSNTVDTNVVNGWVQITNGTWSIYQDPDFLAELSNNGFFGGDATLSLMISNSSSGTIILPPQNFYFRIAGENPDPVKCKAYINTNAGSMYWYAYAIAKEETKNEGKTGFYNHFLDRGAKHKDLLGKAGTPDWNDDTTFKKDTNNVYILDANGNRIIKHDANGSGGYGLFQLTYAHDDDNFIEPRSWLWNWQSNTLQAITELQGKYSSSLSLYNGLQSTYPSDGPIPNHLSFTGLESIVITSYNGMYGGSIKSIPVNGSLKSTCWLPFGKRWKFLPNDNNYVDEVNAVLDK